MSKNNEYLEQVAYYQVNINSGAYHQWRQELLTNHPLTPEIVGSLLGQASPVFIKVKCEICIRPIKKGTEWDRRTIGELLRIDLIKGCDIVHQACIDKKKRKYDKRLAKYQKNAKRN